MVAIYRQYAAVFISPFELSGFIGESILKPWLFYSIPMAIVMLTAMVVRISNGLDPLFSIITLLAFLTLPFIFALISFLACEIVYRKSNRPSEVGKLSYSPGAFSEAPRFAGIFKSVAIGFAVIPVYLLLSLLLLLTGMSILAIILMIFSVIHCIFISVFGILKSCRLPALQTILAIIFLNWAFWMFLRLITYLYLDAFGVGGNLQQLLLHSIKDGFIGFKGNIPA
jgi:hypothetical protein